MVVSTESRLAGIRTSWTLVMRAHENEDTLANSARFQLLNRYSEPAWRYLLGVTRNQAAAEDLFQEFVVRILQGRFRGANPSKGRFRDYLKRVLINLVNDHFRSNSLTIELADQIPAPASMGEEEADDFDRRWRSELLRRTWRQLRDRHSMMYTVLKIHVDDSQASAIEKAKMVEAITSETISVNRFRVTLHRAREKFSKILESEVAATLDSPTEDQLCEELKQLRLLRYCRDQRSSRTAG